MSSLNTIPLAAFEVDRGSRLGLQKQIQSSVVEGISAGVFEEGARMPSSRALANYLDISRITVTLAYAELASIGFLVAQDRSGYYVSHEVSDQLMLKAERATKAEPGFEPRFAHQYSKLQNKLVRPDDWRKYPFCFIYGQADPTVIDHYHWRQCSLEALGRKDFDLLALDTYENDDPMLVNDLLRIILPRRGIFANEDEVMVTMGALNALWFAAQLFLDKSKTAVIENPCYPTLRNMLMNRDCSLINLDVDAEGFVPESIPDGVDLVFTTPSHQCPTTVNMPTHRRRALIEKAERDDFVIVEDDYEFENQLVGGPKPALKSLDRQGRVIYVGSFSKALFPGLRMGYMVASPEIIKEARALRSMVMRNPPNHTQRTVAYFQSLGYFDRQLKRIARIYGERHDAMCEAIEKYGLEFASPPEASGSSFWMKTHAHIDTEILAGGLLEKGVLIEAGAPFFDPKSPRKNFYRLAYSSIEPAKIDRGISLICEEIARLE